jgi:hypothetical protein
MKMTTTKRMYSPKISEALIPRIYRAAKEARIPMTRWVNRVVERALPEVVATPQTIGSAQAVAGLDSASLSVKVNGHNPAREEGSLLVMAAARGENT